MSSFFVVATYAIEPVVRKQAMTTSIKILRFMHPSSISLMLYVLLHCCSTAFIAQRKI